MVESKTSDLAEFFLLPTFDPGWVWLVGAGPGDPGLLTLLAAHALAQADVVLYDALVNLDLLDLAGAKAQRVFAGKRKGDATAQTDISAELVALARKNLRVLRLKGGDPFVFGRGGEEALALAQAGIPFRVVPGITAGIGGLAYAGIPVTHRDVNHAVTFITGHGPDGNIPALDWAAVAKGSPTLVLYMALAHADEIAARLMAAGRGRDEPAAIVSNATLPQQTVIETSLGELGADAPHSAAPAIFVVGGNARLRAELAWFRPIARAS